MTDSHVALFWVEQITAIGVCVSALEWLAQPERVRETGLFSWTVLRLRHPRLVEGLLAKALDKVFSYHCTITFMIVRLGLGFALLALPLPFSVRNLAVGLLAVATILLRLRAPIGLDGSDQMSSIVLITATLAHIVGTDPAISIVLWFLTFQALLAYSVSGWLKLREAGWRDGTFLGRVLSSRTYGHQRFGPFLKRHRRLAAGFSQLFILTECCFPFALIAPKPIAMLILCGGIAFHVVTAIVMGLNTFVWAFTATYPAIIYCRGHMNLLSLLF